jgi:hypothetical protein
MGEPIREVSPRLKRRIYLVHSAGPAFAMALLWGCFLLDVLFNVDLIAVVARHKPDASDWAIALLLAVAATLIGPAIAVVQVRKALSLARNGVEVIGHVTKVGSWSRSGLVKAECQYSYRGLDYTYAWSHPKHGPTPLAEGDHIALVIDPANPHECMLKDEVCLTNIRS